MQKTVDNNKKHTKKHNTKKSILFIIFPGNGSTIEHYKLNDVNGKFDKKNPFLKELKKIGQVYFAYQNWNNISYYDENEKEERHLYGKNIDFTLEDLNMKNICSKIYNDVKDFKGSFVLIGHSIGSFPLYYFSQTYASRCLYSFIIDGSLWGPFYIDKKIHDEYVKKTLNITNEDIQDLIKKIKTTKTTKTKNDNTQDAILKLNDIISGYLEKQMPTTAKYLKVKTYSLRNLQINADPGGGKDTDKIIQTKIQAEDYFIKHNPKLYNTKYLVNKTHMVFWNKEGRYHILEIIKCCIANE